MGVFWFCNGKDGKTDILHGNLHVILHQEYSGHIL